MTSTSNPLLGQGLDESKTNGGVTSEQPKEETFKVDPEFLVEVDVVVRSWTDKIQTSIEQRRFKEMRNLKQQVSKPSKCIT